MHKTTPEFWQSYADLPADTQSLANKNFKLLESDDKHPSLHFKKVGQFWSARVGLHYRALAVERPHGFTWVWIGHHTVYDRLNK